MKIVMVSAELAPYASTGGLGESVAQLARALARAGHQLTVILPAYTTTDGSSHPELWRDATVEGNIQIPVGARQVQGRVLRTQLPGAPVEVLLLEQPEYYHRPGIYQPAGQEYQDQCARFVFLCRGALQMLSEFDIDPDIIHAHDWPTGLIPALHKIEYRRNPGYEHLATVFSVHNMAYQGQFLHWDMELTGLDWRYFNWRQMECFGKLNLLKTGLAFADHITTTSPTYTEEIQDPAASHGLHGVIRFRQEDITGILNGLDSTHWNPAHDPDLVLPFDHRTFATGKLACKTALQKQVGLPQRPELPLILWANPQTPEQGLQILTKSAPQWPWSDLQFLILQEGRLELPDSLRALQQQLPESFAVVPRTTESLVRQALAGADLTLHLSLHEPCATRQMEALAYGAVPISHLTGALADTVVDATASTLRLGTATGFGYSAETGTELTQTVQRALMAYADRVLWRQIVQAGMHHEWSWAMTADQYVAVYREAALRESKPQPLTIS